MSDSCNPLDYNPPGSSVHEISQARKGLPFPSPVESSQPRNRTSSPELQVDSLPTELQGKPEGLLWAIYFYHCYYDCWEPAYCILIAALSTASSFRIWNSLTRILSLPGASMRKSAHGKGHKEGGLAYAKGGSSLRSSPGNSRASTPQTRVCLLSALCSHLYL